MEKLSGGNSTSACSRAIERYEKRQQNITAFICGFVSEPLVALKRDRPCSLARLKNHSVEIWVD
jgi:hypothetical protein